MYFPLLQWPSNTVNFPEGNILWFNQTYQILHNECKWAHSALLGHPKKDTSFTLMPSNDRFSESK